MVSSLVRGVIAGTVGTLAMSGFAYTYRRFREPDEPITVTHYERVGLALTGVVQQRPIGQVFEDPDAIMTLEQRRRLGEVLHFGFGIVNAIPLAFLARRRGRDISVAEGALVGAALWFFGFGLSLPRLGVTGGIASMPFDERRRSMLSHLTFGTMTALGLRIGSPASRVGRSGPRD
jgi:uncharacterized membrane protein YagU involved in acid resistance